MGQRVSRNDFEWSYTEEPHATRRKEMLSKYPEIKQLYGPDRKMPVVVGLMVLFQLISVFMVSSLSWPVLISLAYCLGGTINHALMLAVHEIAHNLAFGAQYPRLNRLFGIFANFPVGFPFSISFRGYHLEHHRYQGDCVLDTDLPSELEARLFCTSCGKLLWLFLQPLFYTLRPVMVNPKLPTALELFNIAAQLVFNTAVVVFCGWKSLVYLMAGSLLAMGVHPVAGHFVSEHYMFRKGYETYSYYGCLNLLTFNVGYHNEHHDFPYICGWRLPEVRNIAPEYYDSLPHHNSWLAVLYDFVVDPDIGPYARVKRQTVVGAERVEKDK